MNITKIINIIEECKRHNLEGFIVNVDFEKAFDCLEWSFMEKALEFFGFPRVYIQWIMTLYNDISTCVQNNGNLSEFFKPERGVRQGCPISPYLFVIAAETLALYLKQKSQVIGIDLNNKMFLLSQFADDTTIFLANTPNNIKNCLHTLHKFQEISGLKMNTNKTEVMPLGNTNTSSIREHKLTTVNEYTKILGIKVAYDTIETTKLNYTNTADKLKQKLQLWKNRKLSIIGKTTIIKTIAIPQLIYLLTVLPTPDASILDSIDKTLTEFLWNSKTNHIKKKLL